MRGRLFLAAGFLVAAFTCAAYARNLCLDGCPEGAPASDRVVTRSIYILSNNGTTKFADWVAYRVTRDTIGKSQRRVWKRDPALPADETLSPKDYDGAHAALKVDRGHQAPLASLTGTPDWREANYLSNITPQASALNEGPWQYLEAAVRKLATTERAAAVYVVTGPLYEQPMPSLPEAHLPHEVPSAYWKVVAIEDDGSLRTAAFIMHQDTPRRGDYCNYAVTVREVETRAHLDFFPDLPPAEDDRIEMAPGKLMPDLGCSFD